MNRPAQSDNRVRVGIVSWNTAELLDRCLEALPQALGDVAADVRVVDNASSDHSVEVARRHGIEVVANPTNVGYARAMNQALAGQGDVLCALNPDAEPEPGSIARLVDTVRTKPDVGLATARLVNDDGSPQQSTYRFPSVQQATLASLHALNLVPDAIAQRNHLHNAASPTSGSIEWAIGAVHVIRRLALAGEVPYRERSFMYAEDLDTCLRLHRRGWTIRYEADAVVKHTANAAGAQAFSSDRTDRYWEATYDVLADHFGPGSARSLAAVNALATRLLSSWFSSRSDDFRRGVGADLRAAYGVHRRVATVGPPTPDQLAGAPR